MLVKEKNKLCHHHGISIVHTFISTIALDQSVWDTLFSYCKMLFLSHNYFCCFQLSTPHQWLEGNLPVSARCSVCDEVCGSKRRLQGFRCLWCNMMVSNGRLQGLTFQHIRGCLKKKTKKNLNSSLSFGQAALTYCLPKGLFFTCLS